MTVLQPPPPPDRDWPASTRRRSEMRKALETSVQRRCSVDLSVEIEEADKARASARTIAYKLGYSVRTALYSHPDPGRVTLRVHARLK